MLASPSRLLRVRTESLARLTLLLLLAMALLEPLLTVLLSANDQALTGEGNSARQFAYLTISVFALASTGLNEGRIPSRILPFSILAMLLWCTFSIFWALDPGISARRLLLTAIIIYCTFLLVTKVGYYNSLRLIRLLLVIILIINFLFVIGWQDLAIHQEATEQDLGLVGAWRGILVQKNFTGAVCALTVLFFLFDAQNVKPIVRFAVIFGATYFLVKTESKTSTALLVLSVGLGILSLAYRVRYRAIVVVVFMASVIILLTITHHYWFLVEEVFQDEGTLTGRVQIWPLLYEFWQAHWLLGSGFGSFWNIGSASPISTYTDGWIATITSGHNGYLDILVQTGLPGLALAIIATIIAPIHRLLGSELSEPSRRALLTALVLFAIGHNLTETSIFDRDNTMNVILMFSIALIGAASRLADKNLVSD